MGYRIRSPLLFAAPIDRPRLFRALQLVMRFVTILILFTLAAAAYVANFAASDRKPSGDSNTSLVSGQDGRELAVLNPDSARSNGDSGPMVGSSLTDGNSAGSSSSSAGESGPGSTALPNEFPSELTRRSRGSRDNGSSQGTESQGSRLGSGADATTSSDGATAAGSLSNATPTRRRVAPTVRQPSSEENAQRDRLVAERFGTEPAGTDPVSAGSVSQGPAAPSQPEVQDIKIPRRTPARERGAQRTVQLADIDPVAGEPKLEAAALDAAVKGAAQQASDSTLGARDAAQETIRSTIDSTVNSAVNSTVNSLDGASQAGRDVGASAPVSPKVDALATASLRAKVLDSSGAAVPKVEVTVINAATNRAALMLTAGEDGVLFADALRPGRYRLQVEKDSVPLGISSPIGTQNCRVGTELPGYGSVCVELKDNQPTVMTDIVLPLSSGIQGTILGRTGAPVKGVLVRAISQVPGFEGQRTVAETNDKGFFFFGLVPGPYELQMLLPGKGRPEELTRSMDVLAKPGSALLLDAVDFSKRAPERQSRAASPPVPTVEPASRRMKPAAQLAAKPAAQPAPKPAAAPVAAPRAVEAAFSPQRSTSETTLPESKVALRSSTSLVEPVLRAQTTVGTWDETKDPVATGKPGRVELRGRVISKWGESVPALSVIAESLEGRVLEATQTSDNGQYILEDLPVGTVIVKVASNLVVNREGRYGTTLLKRPESVRVQTFPGQKRVSLKDVVVDIRRIYRLSGRIKVQPEALAEFAASLGRANKGQPELTEKQLRRAYYRGLRLTQKNKGTKGDSKNPLKALGQAIKIQYDGSFVWTCPLPAEDIVLVLEPRSSRKSSGYKGPVGIPVTPAGVRPTELEIVYPPVAVVNTDSE